MMPKENVKNMAYLGSRSSDAGFETRALEIHSVLRDTDLTADIVHNAIGSQRVQTIRVSDAFAHPTQLLFSQDVR